MVKKNPACNVKSRPESQISKWFFLYLIGIVNPSSRIITMAHFIPHQISLLCNYHLPLSLSLSGKIDGWNILRNM